MNPEKAELLKAAALQVEQVVQNLPYHLKLKLAWKGLSKVITEATNPEDGQERNDLVNGSKDAS